MFRIIPRMCLIERQTKDLKRKRKQSSSKSIGMKYREEWSKIFQELVNEFADEFLSRRIQNAATATRRSGSH